MPTHVFITPAFRDRLHRRDNRYRFNKTRGYWEFDDGVGPWAPSGMLAGCDWKRGVKALVKMGFIREVPRT